MSDSPTSDAEPEASDPQDSPEPSAQPDNAPRSGGMGDIEEGIAHLFASLERGVMNIAKSQGDKRRAAAAAAAAGEAGDTDGEPSNEIAAAVAKPARAPRAGMTYDEVLAPRQKRSKKKRAEAAAVAGPDEEPVAGDTDPRDDVEARPGMTYEEALAPIRWRNLFLGVVVAIVLFALYVGATFLQVWSSADDDETQPVDAIIVLGAAQFDGTPSPVLAARLDHALDLYEQRLGRFIITTGSNREGDRFTEGFSGFVYLREAGVPEDAILTIVDGADTYQQMTASLAQIEERELATAMLVSDGYHNHRLRSIADEIGLEAYVSPTSIEPTTDDYMRETAAVSIGRLLGYRRLSAWNTEADSPDAN